MSFQNNPPYGGQQSPEITPYARKYGIVLPEDLPFLSDKKSSGLAPRLVLPLTRMEYFLEMGMEKSQREQFYGFTTQELIDLGAHEKAGMRPSNLGGPVHPIFERDKQWIPTLKEHAIGDGLGNWDSRNDFLWRAIEPCFLLASRMIESSALHPW